MKKRISILRSNVWKGYADVRHFFFNYPWKKVFWHRPGVDDKRPYIPVSMRTDDEKSVNVKEYISIIEAYFDEITEELIKGEAYRFSSEMGEIRLVRYKSKKRGKASAKLIAAVRKEHGFGDIEAKDYIKQHPELINKFTYYNSHLGGHKFNIAWFRHDWNIVFGSYWSLKLSGFQWRKVWDHLLAQPSDIYKFQSSTKVQQ